MQPQKLLKGVKVAVVVQQGVIVQQAKSRNQAVHRPTHSPSLSAQRTIILGHRHRQFCAAGFKDFKLQ